LSRWSSGGKKETEERFFLLEGEKRIAKREGEQKEEPSTSRGGAGGDHLTHEREVIKIVAHSLVMFGGCAQLPAVLIMGTLKKASGGGKRSRAGSRHRLA